MVEELIAEGHTREQVVQILIDEFGLSPGDAELMVATALGEDGDLIVTVVDDLDGVE